MEPKMEPNKIVAMGIVGFSVVMVYHGIVGMDGLGPLDWFVPYLTAVMMLGPAGLLWYLG